MSVKNCTITSTKDENGIKCEVVPKCIFVGSPPFPFNSWLEWVEKLQKSGVCDGVRIESIVKI